MSTEMNVRSLLDMALATSGCEGNSLQSLSLSLSRSLASNVSMRCHCVSFLFSHRKNRAINYGAAAHIFFLFAFEQK